MNSYESDNIRRDVDVAWGLLHEHGSNFADIAVF